MSNIGDWEESSYFGPYKYGRIGLFWTHLAHIFKYWAGWRISKEGVLFKCEYYYYSAIVGFRNRRIGYSVLSLVCTLALHRVDCIFPLLFIDIPKLKTSTHFASVLTLKSPHTLPALTLPLPRNHIFFQVYTWSSNNYQFSILMVKAQSFITTCFYSMLCTTQR